MAPLTGQKAKMLAGELYVANDPELHAAHLRAQALLAKFNVTPAGADAERRALLTELFARFGEGTVLKPTLRCDYGFRSCRQIDEWGNHQDSQEGMGNALEIVCPLKHDYILSQIILVDTPEGA